MTAVVTAFAASLLAAVNLSLKSASDYRYVDIATDVDIQGVGMVTNENGMILRGEDVAFLTEAAEERYRELAGGATWSTNKESAVDIIQRKYGREFLINSTNITTSGTWPAYRGYFSMDDLGQEESPWVRQIDESAKDENWFLEACTALQGGPAEFKLGFTGASESKCLSGGELAEQYGNLDRFRAVGFWGQGQGATGLSYITEEGYVSVQPTNKEDTARERWTSEVASTGVDRTSGIWNFADGGPSPVGYCRKSRERRVYQDRLSEYYTLGEYESEGRGTLDLNSGEHLSFRFSMPSNTWNAFKSLADRTTTITFVDLLGKVRTEHYEYGDGNSHNQLSTNWCAVVVCCELRIYEETYSLDTVDITVVSDWTPYEYLIEAIADDLKWIDDTPAPDEFEAIRQNWPVYEGPNLTSLTSRRSVSIYRANFQNKFMPAIMLVHNNGEQLPFHARIIEKGE